MRKINRPPEGGGFGSVVTKHQAIEMAVDLDKMHLFERKAPNLRVKTEG
jgi:hypothetical protein